MAEAAGGVRRRFGGHPLRDAQEHGGSLQVVKSLETGKGFTTNLREQENVTD
jgi:hypothetical protein